MNTTLISVADTTKNTKVLAIAEKLIAYRNRPLRITFTKKDGTDRVIKCVVKNGYNDIMGIDSTATGRKIAASKVAKGMIIVSEMYVPEGARGCPTAIRPRTINLNTIKDVVVL